MKHFAPPPIFGLATPLHHVDLMQLKRKWNNNFWKCQWTEDRNYKKTFRNQFFKSICLFALGRWHY